MLVSATPDSGAVVPGLDDHAVFRFNEVIAERALDQMILLSPRPRALDVSWRRSALAIKPREGWQPGQAYRLTLLPGITDLRNNKLGEGKTLLFSTGGPIPATTLSGRVVDWEAGTVGMRALVEAIRVSDSTVYWDVADSAGKFSLVAVPPGQYVFKATADRNTNRRPDYNEPFDSTIVTLDSTVSRTFWTFVHDTVGPRIRMLTRVDSMTIRVDFNQVLDPERRDSASISILQLPDSTPFAVASILTQQAWDSVQAAARPGGAAGGADTAAAQPADPAGLPVGPPPAQRVPAPAPPRPGGQAPGMPGRAGAPTAAPVDSTVIQLLKERPRLSSSRIVRTVAPIAAGGRYLVSARAINLTGAIGESSSVLVIPAAADTTRRAR